MLHVCLTDESGTATTLTVKLKNVVTQTRLHTSRPNEKVKSAE